MNNQEAKFILGAYRPDGRDANDAMFTEALAQAERDPELRAWLERERTFDAAFSKKLKQIEPPSGLRDAIIAGVRASQPRRNWWAHPSWLGAAAAIAIVAVTTFALRGPTSGTSMAQLVAFALNDTINSHDDHVGHPPTLSAEQAQLASVSTPLAKEMKLNLDELRRKGCRSVRIGGRELFEICFLRDGVWYHLYAAERKGFAPGGDDPQSLISSREGYASTAWADSKYVYALVTSAGAEALRRVI
jgi:anti-sigma-K factor RskA